MQIKQGVKLDLLRPQILLAVMVADQLYTAAGAELVITSGNDGKHKVGSKHYSGDAVDLRIWNLPKGSVEGIAKQMQDKLGDNFDVVLESDHFHVEFDP